MSSPNFDINKIFTLTTQKTEDGKSISGINSDDFYAAAKSIFTKDNVNFSSIFSDLDEDGDNILTSEELASLTSHLNQDMEDTLEEASSSGTLEGILNANQSMETKLSQIKTLDLKDGDLKSLNAGDLKDLLNIISGAYANNPEDIKGDTLFTMIKATVPKGELQDILGGENKGYWLGKYGADIMTNELKLDDENKDENAMPEMDMDFSGAMDG